MIQIYILIISGLFFSASVLAADDGTSVPEFREPITPIIIGAALITWGAYELGDDVESSQRNVQLLWGGALVVSAGLVLYQSSNDKGSKILVSPTHQGGASIAYSFRF
ncbi:hypothetical protein AYI82_21915 [Shewanella algae]|uniref:hypothetical protein n=1 Tax=Shewanella algae TaxID=38313 RepID=UPI001184209D|nr:hypothetical protein [Shewanella algae]TVL01304.1 hypothetical protein AYI82_21915 [Shewanella algae]